MYVKLEDGDSEWSASPQQVIPLYPYEPAKVSASSTSDTAPPPKPLGHDATKAGAGGACGGGDGDDDGDARKESPITDGKNISNMSSVMVEKNEEEQEAPLKALLLQTDLPVSTHDSLGVDQESLTGTALSNPATNASAPRESTPTNSLVHRNSDLVRSDPQDPASVSVVATSVPPLGDEQQAGGSGASRVVAGTNPDERSVAKSIPHPDTVEPPYGGNLSGLSETVKKSVGGSTVLSPSALGTPRGASTAEGISPLPHAKALPDTTATATPPPDAAAGYVDTASCSGVNKSASRESTPAPALPGSKLTARGLSSGSSPVSAEAARATVSENVPAGADAAQSATFDSATGALSPSHFERKPTPEGFVERNGVGVSYPVDGTGGGQAENKEHRETPNTPSSESAPPTVPGAATTAASSISPNREDDTSNPNLVASDFVGAVGAPDPTGGQRVAGDDTTTTTSEKGTCGVVPATQSRTGREEVSQQPTKLGSGAKAVQGGTGVSHGDDRREPEKPDAAAQGRGTNYSRVQPSTPETVGQPGADPVEPLKNTVEGLKEKGVESGHANHGTSSPPPPPLSLPASRDCGECARRESLRLSVQRR